MGASAPTNHGESEKTARVLRLAFVVTSALAFLVWMAATQLPTNRVRLAGACSGDRATGPNYAEWTFWLACGLWVLAAVLTVALADRERRRASFVALRACLAIAAWCGLNGACIQFRLVSAARATTGLAMMTSAVETRSVRMSAWMRLLSVGLLAAAAVLMWQAWGHFPTVDCEQVGEPGYHPPGTIGSCLVLASILCALGGSVVFAVANGARDILCAACSSL